MYTLLSPWPTQRSGIADYAYEISRHGRSNIRLVTEALHPKDLGSRLSLQSSEDYLKAPGGRRLYHFGNNPDHAFLVGLFMREPGIAVVHDASLHYLAEKTDALIPGFYRAMLEQDAPAAADKWLHSWRNGLKRAFDHSEIKCLSWLKSASSVIVHSQYARRVVQGRLPGVKVNVIPHFAFMQPGQLPSQLAREEARRALNLPRDAYILSSIGFVTRSKQYESVIRAVLALPRYMRQKIIYIIAGEVNSDDYNIHQVIRELGASFVRVRDYVSDETLNHLLYASDLIFNLRYPTMGESSGSVARALGAGAVLVVPAAGSFGEIPSEACFHVSARLDVSAEVTKILEQCIDNPDQLQQKKDAAQAFAHMYLTPAVCAARYEEIIYAD